jgi:D-alanyl-D-alanine carboxypeptidase (penicillin-binding protein 5/6)
MTRVWHNKNRLLQTYPGADGVKTGWTRASGYCLVASANRNGQRLVAVVLNSLDDWGETAALLNYGFANYKSVLVVSSGQYLRTVEVDKGYPRYIAAVASDDFSWPVGKGEELELRYLLQLDQALTAPLRKGDAIGHLLLIQGTETVATLPVITDQDVVGGWWQQLLRSLFGNFTQLLLRRGEYA